MSDDHGLTFRQLAFVDSRIRADVIRRFESIVESSTVEGSFGCIITKAALKSTRVKYPVFKVAGTSVYIHIVAAIYKQLQCGITVPWDGTLEVSHICGNRRCININHLELETHEVNESRNGCPNPLRCALCPARITACSHTKPCLKKDKFGICDACSKDASIFD